MTNVDEYNGWTNRETWAVNLHLSNDEGLCNMTLEQAEQAWNDAKDEDDFDGTVSRFQIARRLLADVLKDQFEEWAQDVVDGEYTTKETRMMFHDIGSLYRVDWYEIAEGWLDDFAAERFGIPQAWPNRTP